jgi:outer membrane murein-binding lipoprotein Lpp
MRLFTVLAIAIVSGLALTGCPEKKAEKEEPATPDVPAAADQSGTDEKKADEKKEEKKDEAADDKDKGGW